MKKVPYFCCSIPWTGFSNEPDGRAQPCCLYKGYITDENDNPLYIQNNTPKEILTSNFMKNLRQQFLQGKKPKGCQTCWTDEENGYESKRIIYNTKIHTDVDWFNEPTTVKELQLIINNSCNLKCRSCTPSHSTQWQQELKKITGETGYSMPLGQSGKETGKLWQDRFQWYKELYRLEVVGGEPFYVKQWHQIFNELIDHGFAKNIDLTFSTNCTIFYKGLIEKICKGFKSVSIGLSIDGIGNAYEYLRHPGKWEIAFSNMKKYRDLTQLIDVNVQLNHTISWLNAFESPKIHKLIYEEFPNFNIWNNIVHYPLHLPLYNAPDALKQDIHKEWKKFKWQEQYIDNIESILSFMYSKTITDCEFSQALDIIKKTDTHRNENLLNSIPQLKKYIKNY